MAPSRLAKATAAHVFLLVCICFSCAAHAAECLDSCAKDRRFSPFNGSKQNGVQQITIYVNQNARDNPHFDSEDLESAVNRWNQGCPGVDSLPGLVFEWDKPLPADFDSFPLRAIYFEFVPKPAPIDEGLAKPAAANPDELINTVRVFETCPPKDSTFGDYGLPCDKNRLIKWNHAGGIQALAHEIGHMMGIAHDGAGCKQKTIMAEVTPWNVANLKFHGDQCALADRMNDKDNLCTGSVVLGGSCDSCQYEVAGQITGVSEYQSMSVRGSFKAGGFTVTESVNTVGGSFAFSRRHPVGVEYTIEVDPPENISCQPVFGHVQSADVEVTISCLCTNQQGGFFHYGGGVYAPSTTDDACNPPPDNGIWLELFPFYRPDADFCTSIIGLCAPFGNDFWWWRAPRLPGDCREDRVCYYFRPCPDPGQYPVDQEGGCQVCFDSCTVNGSAFFGPPVVLDALPDVAEGTIEISGWAGGPRRLDGMVVLLDKEPITLDGWAQGLLRADACAWASLGEDCDVFSGFEGRLDTRSLANGVHELMIFAGGGDTDQPVPSIFTYDLNVNNDCTPSTPSVALGGLVAGATVSGTVGLVASASSADGIEQVRFFVDDVRRHTDWTAPYEFQWNTSSHPDGAHQVRAVAVGRCGGTASSPTVSVTVANANDLPQLAVETPTPFLQLSGVATVSGWAFDADGIASVSLRLGTQILPLASPVEWVDRSDVCSGSGGVDPRCPRVGWRTSFDTTLWPDGAYGFQVVVVDGRGASASRSMTLSIRNAPVAPPTVSTPASRSVVAGDDVAFSVVASGEGPLTYRWQYRSGTSWVSLFDGNRSGRVSGAATHRLELADVVASDQTSYRCLVANEGGTTASSAASLAVSEAIAAPTATAGLSQWVTEGETAHLTVSAQGVDPLAYRWQKWIGSWIDLADDWRVSGAATSVLTIADARSADGGSYRCRVSNAGGTTFSEAVDLTVDPLPVGTCQESSTTLCFQANRFAVTATVNGSAAVSMPFSQEGGFFWIFEPQTVEVVIKILDGTSANGYFWVFHGSLTDLAYTVTVTDTISGVAKTYLKAAGDFCGDADTAAFHGSTSAPLTAGHLVPLAPASAVGRSSTACASSSSLACLLNGKFGVEVLRSGAPQPGVAVTDLSASFGFVTATAPEVVVKVIDGTSVNGWYWLFFGSLTHQDFTVRVTDSATGEFRTYVSPGQFCGGADTAAF
jgi:hypothetical protein